MGGSAIRSRTCVAEHVGMGGDLLPGTPVEASDGQVRAARRQYPSSRPVRSYAWCPSVSHDGNECRSGRCHHPVHRIGGLVHGVCERKACARIHLPELDGAYAVQCGVGNAIRLQHDLKHEHDLQRYGRIGASHHVAGWERSSGVRRLRHVGTQAQTWFTRHAYIGGCYYHFRKNKEAGWLEPSATGFMRIEPEPCGGGVRVPFGARDTRRINPGLGGIGIEPGMGAIVKRD